MANEQMKSFATLLLLLNFYMYVIVLGIGAWAVNRAIDHGFIIGPELKIPADFSPLFFPMGNAATGFCHICFACWSSWCCVNTSGINHIRHGQLRAYHCLDSYTPSHGFCLQRDRASYKKYQPENKGGFSNYPFSYTAFLNSFYSRCSCI